MVCFAHESLWLRGWDFNGDWGSKNWYNHLIGCHFFIISLFHSISFLMQCKIVLTDGGSAQMLRYKQDHDIELVTAHYKKFSVACKHPALFGCILFFCASASAFEASSRLGTAKHATIKQSQHLPKESEFNISTNRWQKDWAPVFSQTSCIIQVLLYM